MSEMLRLLRPFFVMLAIVALGRLLLSIFGVPYVRGHHVFSISTLTVFSCLYYGAFLRRWRGSRLMQAMAVGFTLGLASQLVVLACTLGSYAAGAQTYYNYPFALNVEGVTLCGPTPAPVPLVSALPIRLGGLVGNSIFAGIFGALGWTIGALLPER
jgi:hypothetical protein